MLDLPFLPKKKEADKGVSTNPAIQQLSQGTTTTKDLIAPEAIEVDFSHLKINDIYYRTLFVAGYPRFVNANWLSPLINFNHSLDISMFIYPVEGKGVLEDLRRKIAEMEAEIQGDIQRGRVINIETQVKLEDAHQLQEQLAKGAERFFQFGLYITIRSDNKEELDTITSQVKSTLGSLLIVAKSTTLQMEDGFKTTLPMGRDKINITRNMDTTSLATTFPFTSSELSANEGIVYGINEHNDSLVIFDRFTMENANMVVFAKSGAGKSYMIKLEVLRSLLFESEVIVIDPEDEYRTLCEALGGTYVDFSFSSPHRINPFELPLSKEPDENELSLKIISLHSLMKVIMGNLSPEEEAVLDRALIATYRMKGITRDPSTHASEPPLMEDLYKVLVGMEDAMGKSLATRLEKFIKGSFQGIFNQPSNVNLENKLTVFGIKNLSDELRPIAIFIILDYIWTKVKNDLKKRLLVVDEAWYLMKHPDSAGFLYSIAKRARKYFLGLTTITQDVEDFLNTDYGKAIVTNSSIQILMKQSTAAIDTLAKTFYLSQGERHLLLSAEIGEGLFFAGTNHVAIKVVASPEEHSLVTSKPQDIVKQQQEKETSTPKPQPTRLSNPNQTSPPPSPPAPPATPNYASNQQNQQTQPYQTSTPRPVFKAELQSEN